MSEQHRQNGQTSIMETITGLSRIKKLTRIRRGNRECSGVTVQTMSVSLWFLGVAVMLTLRSWAAPGDPDPAFSVPAVAGGFPTAVSALAVQPDGKILMGGNFSTVWAAERSGIARLNADGSLDTEFAPTNTPADIRTIAVQPDGKVVLGVGYPTGSTPSLMRLNADGSTDTNFTAGFMAGGVIIHGAVGLFVHPR